MKGEVVKREYRCLGGKKIEDVSDVFVVAIVFLGRIFGIVFLGRVFGIVSGYNNILL